MSVSRILASAAVLAMTLTVSAAPAHASTVFAQFNPNTNADDYRWINNGASDTGTGGHFLSINSSSATTAQGVATHFGFLDPALSALAFVPSIFTIDATVTGPTPASVNGAGVWTQTNLNGHFSLIYTGSTINNYLGSGINLVHNSNLLSGIFTNAWIQGAGGSGSANLSTHNGGLVAYTSDYETFANLRPNTEEFSLNLLGVLPTFGANSGDALKSFRANGGGNFSFETVPEPATWGLMIMGFGGIGAVIRNRRRTAVATA